MSKLRGYLWFIHEYGLRRLWRYERARRAGLRIDYSQVFSPAELQALEDAGIAPWRESQ